MSSKLPSIVFFNGEHSVTQQLDDPNLNSTKRFVVEQPLPIIRNELDNSRKLRSNPLFHTVDFEMMDSEFIGENQGDVLLVYTFNDLVSLDHFLNTAQCSRIYLHYVIYFFTDIVQSIQQLIDKKLVHNYITFPT